MLKSNQKLFPTNKPARLKRCDKLQLLFENCAPFIDVGFV